MDLDNQDAGAVLRNIWCELEKSSANDAPADHGTGSATKQAVGTSSAHKGGESLQQPELLGQSLQDNHSVQKFYKLGDGLEKIAQCTLDSANEIDNVAKQLKALKSSRSIREWVSCSSRLLLKHLHVILSQPMPKVDGVTGQQLSTLQYGALRGLLNLRGAVSLVTAISQILQADESGYTPRSGQSHIGSDDCHLEGTNVKVDDLVHSCNEYFGWMSVAVFRSVGVASMRWAALAAILACKSPSCSKWREKNKANLRDLADGLWSTLLEFPIQDCIQILLFCLSRCPPQSPCRSLPIAMISRVVVERAGMEPLLLAMLDETKVKSEHQSNAIVAHIVHVLAPKPPRFRSLLEYAEALLPQIFDAFSRKFQRAEEDFFGQLCGRLLFHWNQQDNSVIKRLFESLFFDPTVGRGETVLNHKVLMSASGLWRHCWNLPIADTLPLVVMSCASHIVDLHVSMALALASALVHSQTEAIATLLKCLMGSSAARLRTNEFSIHFDGVSSNIGKHAAEAGIKLKFGNERDANPCFKFVHILARHAPKHSLDSLFAAIFKAILSAESSDSHHLDAPAMSNIRNLLVSISDEFDALSANADSLNSCKSPLGWSSVKVLCQIIDQRLKMPNTQAQFPDQQETSQVLLQELDMTVLLGLLAGGIGTLIPQPSRSTSEDESIGFALSVLQRCVMLLEDDAKVLAEAILGVCEQALQSQADDCKARQKMQSVDFVSCSAEEQGNYDLDMSVVLSQAKSGDPANKSASMFFLRQFYCQAGRKEPGPEVFVAVQECLDCSDPSVYVHAISFLVEAAVWHVRPIVDFCVSRIQPLHESTSSSSNLVLCKIMDALSSLIRARHALSSFIAKRMLQSASYVMASSDELVRACAVRLVGSAISHSGISAGPWLDTGFATLSTAGKFDKSFLVRKCTVISIYESLLRVLRTDDSDGGWRRIAGHHLEECLSALQACAGSSDWMVRARAQEALAAAPSLREAGLMRSLIQELN